MLLLICVDGLAPYCMKAARMFSHRVFATKAFSFFYIEFSGSVTVSGMSEVEVFKCQTSLVKAELQQHSTRRHVPLLGILHYFSPMVML